MNLLKSKITWFYFVDPNGENAIAVSGTPMTF